MNVLNPHKTPSAPPCISPPSVRWLHLADPDIPLWAIFQSAVEEPSHSSTQGGNMDLCFPAWVSHGLWVVIMSLLRVITRVHSSTTRLTTLQRGGKRSWHYMPQLCPTRATSSHPGDVQNPVQEQNQDLFSLKASPGKKAGFRAVPATPLRLGQKFSLQPRMVIHLAGIGSAGPMWKPSCPYPIASGHFWPPRESEEGLPTPLLQSPFWCCWRKMASWQLMEHRLVCGFQERHSLAHCLWTASANTELSCYYIYKSGLFFQWIIFKCFVSKTHPSFHWLSTEKFSASQKPPASTPAHKPSRIIIACHTPAYQQKKGQQVLSWFQITNILDLSLQPLSVQGH